MSAKQKTGMKHAILTFVALILIIGIYVGITQFSNIAKSITEKVATNALKTPVHIETMDIDIPNLSVNVKNISIENPKGYGFSNKNIMTINEVLVDVESFETGLLAFESIGAIGTEVFLEAKSNKVNLAILKENLKAPKSDTEIVATTDEGEPIKVIIRNLHIGEGALYPSVDLVDDLPEKVDFGPVKITGIGVREEGAIARDAIEQAFEAIVNTAVNKALAEGVFKGVEDIIGKTQDQVGKKFEELDKEAQDLIKNFMKQREEAGEQN